MRRYFRKGLTGLILCLLISPAWANPEGGSVAAGSATFNTNGDTFEVNQTTNKLVLRMAISLS